jgi:hypothetical protein
MRRLGASLPKSRNFAANRLLDGGKAGQALALL